MKFFFLIKKSNYTSFKKPQYDFLNDYIFPEKNFSTTIVDFNKFLIKKGLLLKSKYILSTLFKSFNYFFFFKKEFLYINYPTQK